MREPREVQWARAVRLPGAAERVALAPGHRLSVAGRATRPLAVMRTTFLGPAERSQGHCRNALQQEAMGEDRAARRRAPGGLKHAARELPRR
jgi:hypothetical protein